MKMNDLDTYRRGEFVGVETQCGWGDTDFERSERTEDEKKRAIEVAAPIAAQPMSKSNSFFYG